MFSSRNVATQSSSFLFPSRILIRPPHLDPPMFFLSAYATFGTQIYSFQQPTRPPASQPFFQPLSGTTGPKAASFFRALPPLDSPPSDCFLPDSLPPFPRRSGNGVPASFSFPLSTNDRAPPAPRFQPTSGNGTFDPPLLSILRRNSLQCPLPPLKRSTVDDTFPFRPSNPLFRNAYGHHLSLPSVLVAGRERFRPLFLSWMRRRHLSFLSLLQHSKRRDSRPLVSHLRNPPWENCLQSF